MALQTREAIADYEALADEYYDTVRHPTCANFREASGAILRPWLQDGLAFDLQYCEVGAGKSLLAEILAPRLKDLDLVTLIDDSSAMLALSRRWVDLGANLVEADVSRRIALSRQSVDVLVSSLGDPYNVDGFWAEAHRVVRPGGRVFYTTPSYEWASAFRRLDMGATHTAEFVLASGRSVRVRSYIYPADEQVDLVMRHGFVVDEVVNVPVSAVKDTPMSPKLITLCGNDGSVVTGYGLTRAN